MLSMIKILVVDDEESILKGIRLNLGRIFDITLANGPQEALQTFKDGNSFDVVVSDMRMPGMDGATMLRKIKENYPQVMTILLTGHADFEFGGSQALQSGMLFRILNKPCPPQKLAATIKAAIEERDGTGKEEEKAPDSVL
jgi:DNA-binding NtrC family response regulator